MSINTPKEGTNKMKKLASSASTGAMVALAGVFAVAMLAGPSSTEAGRPWQSITADFDFTEECFTDQGVDELVTEGTTGGTACFTKSVFVPRRTNVLRVTWSTTGDTHNGNALWITCIITDARTNTRRYCIDGPSGRPGGGAAGTPRGWISAQKLPVAAAGSTNCDDGGGGAADCHDNSIHYTWCTQIPRTGVYTIELRIASSLTGTNPNLNNFVFVEDQVVFIDGTKIQGDNRCVQRDASARLDKWKPFPLPRPGRRR